VSEGGVVLAYCGINCNECPAYKGTVMTDIDLLEKVAGSSWSGPPGASDWVCLGCPPADQGFLAKDCAACKIRACAIAKGAQTCAACGDFESCELIGDFILGVSEPRCREPEMVRTRIEWLRARFLASKEDRAVRAGTQR